ncbi:hypothetical protein HELRODRAFT_173224 [Helobdella robusta]|uniref:Methyltransferase FkbM domain-containing protein n=1 Tax=Helobdella robusta TaxID=6412 RepID=T1F6L1_HELRO|nr:hypothetical protein HELRODRAFT_173224 [Helobdella robusta]ESO03525.1 hypothetical protein HELRODRAFT_173224 [Helobdella robusta]
MSNKAMKIFLMIVLIFIAICIVYRYKIFEQGTLREKEKVVNWHPSRSVVESPELSRISESDLTLSSVLEKIPTAIFLDIGANIGYYTIQAAKLGHRVLAVEPTPDHLKRIHRALELENLTDNVVLLQNALGVNRQAVNIYVSKVNKGDNLMMPLNSNPTLDTHKLSSTVVNAILLNDLEPVLSKISGPQNLESTPVVMKIDIQAMETAVLVTGAHVFAHVNVTFVSMEWEPASSGDVGQKNENLRRFFKERNFLPFNCCKEGALVANMEKCPENVCWRRADD